MENRTKASYKSANTYSKQFPLHFWLQADREDDVGYDMTHFLYPDNSGLIFVHKALDAAHWQLQLLQLL